jgi:hypothetical protein
MLAMIAYRTGQRQRANRSRISQIGLLDNMSQ